jgi:hypothetical protein
VLCGSFDGFIAGEGEPEDHSVFLRAIAALREATQDRQVIMIAAADLAHVGPAFGDQQPVDWVGKARLRAADERLIEAICEGDPEKVFRLVREEGDRRRICGLPPIYLALRLMGGARGQLVGYEHCPADTRRTSFVSVCGVVFK